MFCFGEIQSMRYTILPAGAAAGASVLVGSAAGAAAVVVGAAAASASFLGFFLKMFFNFPFRLSRASSAIAACHVSWGFARNGCPILEVLVDLRTPGILAVVVMNRLV
ncbi:hypothetical protein BR93DRAFT_930441 [Coniochaeta sp. PMI_546]|nr:hypothetical protein BR93DRAFT_930441 [Coniochaeta sp. PMI_546]